MVTRKRVKFDNGSGGKYAKGKINTASTARKKMARQKGQTMIAIPRNYPFPPQMVVTHRYSDIVPVTTNISGVGSYIFSCNGMFDPDITSTGHQPQYFDQLNGIYNHYNVIKSKCSVQPHDTKSIVVQLSMYIDDDASPNASVSYTIAERPGAVTRSILCQASIDVTLQKVWNAEMFFPGDPLANSLLRGTGVANPSEQSYFIIYLDGGAALISGTMYVRVFLEYTAVWDEWVSIGSS